jgi:hypothetical protein
VRVRKEPRSVDGQSSGCGIVHNAAVGPVEIFLVLIVVALVVYVLWRLVVRPRR